MGCMGIGLKQLIAFIISGIARPAWSFLNRQIGGWAGLSIKWPLPLRARPRSPYQIKNPPSPRAVKICEGGRGLGLPGPQNPQVVALRLAASAPNSEVKGQRGNPTPDIGRVGKHVHFKPTSSGFVVLFYNPREFYMAMSHNNKNPQETTKTPERAKQTPPSAHPSFEALNPALSSILPALLQPVRKKLRRGRSPR